MFVDDADSISTNVTIRNNYIGNIQCWNDEVLAAVENNTAVMDARGSVLQFKRSLDGMLISLNEGGSYKGNVVADMQIMVASAIMDGTLPDSPLHQTKLSTINRAIVEWAQNGTTKYEPKYRCRGDAMHHVLKGIIAIRVENTAGVDIRGNKIENIVNLSPSSFDACTDYNAGISTNSTHEYQGGNIRGISLAASRGRGDHLATVVDNHIEDLRSGNADIVVGIDIQGESSDVEVSRNTVNIDPDKLLPEPERLIAIRAREDASNITIRDNLVYQLVQDLSSNSSERILRRTARGVRETSKQGGCPFAHWMH
jgi:hypothetical protein